MKTQANAASHAHACTNTTIALAALAVAILSALHQPPFVRPTLQRGDLAQGAVTTYDLADHTVTAQKLSPDAVTSDAIAAAGVRAPSIASAAVTARAIAAGAVGPAQLRIGAVHALAIGDGAVTARSLADEAVGAAAIANAAVHIRHLSPEVFGSLSDASMEGCFTGCESEVDRALSKLVNYTRSVVRDEELVEEQRVQRLIDAALAAYEQRSAENLAAHERWEARERNEAIAAAMKAVEERVVGGETGLEGLEVQVSHSLHSSAPGEFAVRGAIGADGALVTRDTSGGFSARRLPATDAGDGGRAAGYELLWSPPFDAPPLLLLAPTGYSVCVQLEVTARSGRVSCRAPHLFGFESGTQPRGANVQSFRLGLHNESEPAKVGGFAFLAIGSRGGSHTFEVRRPP